MAVISTAFLPFHRALIEEEEIQGVLDVLHSGWLTTGPKVRQFESAFAQYVGAKHAVAFGSCTAALHLALAAINLQEGDEVILPTMTFASTGEVVLYFKARPVLVDCAKDSFHMDPEAIECAISPRTKAIIPVHFAGIPCDMDAILAIAEKHGVKVIEDAAHSLPTYYKGRMIGTIGDMTCFSFYATKTLTTGEGGMITTENPQHAERLRILSLHGISKDAWKRYTAEGTWRYDILETGYKYNLTDMQAALGLAQLSKCDAMREKRAAIADSYIRALQGLEAFRTPITPSDVQHAWHLYVLQVNSGALRIDRNRVIEELKNRGIGTSVHFIPLHLHTLYQQLGYRVGEFPNAEERFEGSISLPIYPGLTELETDRVIEALHDIAREFRH
ncbi:MAG TPA: DegT/DnrJ/EryC1/StrS aminotransferase family protein [Candidatus Acidoferrum sp.]|nr:DegT/DnrJ/EryC1/StrS aminotransferase family protein [Candidatus Acidoferrum sp.]